MATGLFEYLCHSYAGYSWVGRCFPNQLIETESSAKVGKLNFRVPLDGDVVELPCYGKIKCLDSLSTGGKTIYLPLIENHGGTEIAASSNTILRRFLYDTSTEHRCISKIKLKNADIFYYGGPGIILYGDYTPMLLMTFTLKKLEDGKYGVDKQNVYISPKVFRRTDMLSKYVKSKLLSSLITIGDDYDPHIRHYRRISPQLNHPLLNNDFMFDYNFHITIGEFDEFFVKPVKPSAKMSESPEEFLARSNEDLVGMML